MDNDVEETVIILLVTYPPADTTLLPLQTTNTSSPGSPTAVSLLGCPMPVARSALAPGAALLAQLELGVADRGYDTFVRERGIL